MKNDLGFTRFNESCLYPMHDLIIHTIETCYTGHYSRAAIDFFKLYHTPEIIIDDAQKGYTVVLEADKQLLGTGTLLGHMIKRLFVDPDAQGQGYGKLIMLHLEAIALSRNIKFLDLCASLPSVTFYTSLNYQIKDECAIDLGDGEKLPYIDMRKILQPSGNSDSSQPVAN